MDHWSYINQFLFCKSIKEVEVDYLVWREGLRELEEKDIHMHCELELPIHPKLKIKHCEKGKCEFIKGQLEWKRANERPAEAGEGVTMGGETSMTVDEAEEGRQDPLHPSEGEDTNDDGESHEPTYEEYSLSYFEPEKEFHADQIEYRTLLCDLHGRLFEQ